MNSADLSPTSTMNSVAVSTEPFPELTTSPRNSSLLLYALFFVSGIPALLYQIVWQRSLFAIYGVNVQSVTIVVTAFMLGLGLGSLAGGELSKRLRTLLPAFAAIELGTAFYGVVSLKIFHWAAVFSAGAPPLETTVMAFTLLIIPTMLMGSTLPLLVTHVVRRNRNVGASVGALYAVNTLGSAAACFAAGLFVMWLFGESGSVRVAAALNAMVGTSVLVWHFRTLKQTKEEIGVELAPVANDGDETILRLPVAMALVGVSGLIALAYEIVWYHLFSFVTGTWAKSFAYLLGAYLAGIAAGSFGGERIANGGLSRKTMLTVVAWLVLVSNVVGFMVAPSLGTIVQHASFLWTLPLIALAAGMLGATFPLLCHISVPPDSRAGARLSYLYASNIAGSAIGSYVIGFVLMDFLSIKYIAMVLGIAGIVLAAVLLYLSDLPSMRRYAAFGAVGACMLLVPLSTPKLFHHLYEKLLFKAFYQPPLEFRFTTETKSGVANVLYNGQVYGGGMYDGAFAVGMVNDRNGIFRAYAVNAFHPQTRDVLLIGVASGSWAQVIANFPSLRSMTIVEINPGYLPLIAKYPQTSSLLTNPKVKFVIDDGRRWLLHNPDAKFDAIVMNTTFHWRAHATNLLSREFLEMVRPHLAPGGVLYYNTTASPEVFATGARTYPYALRVANFMAVSDSPITVNKERWRAFLASYQIGGVPLFNHANPQHLARLEQVLKLCDTWNTDPTTISLENRDSILQRTKSARTITDDNMGTEWDPNIHGTEDFSGRPTSTPR